jgi:hypothetical protein
MRVLRQIFLGECFAFHGSFGVFTPTNKLRSEKAIALHPVVSPEWLILSKLLFLSSANICSYLEEDSPICLNGFLKILAVGTAFPTIESTFQVLASTAHPTSRNNS